MRRSISVCAAIICTLAIPATLHALTGPLQDDAGGWAGFIIAIVTPLVGWLSTIAYDGLKTVIPAYDRLPSLIHQIAAPLFGLAFGWLTTHLGVGLLTDIHAVGPEWIGALLNVLLMAGIKRWQKTRSPGDGTIKLEETRV